jgi:hypothetical protein
MDFVLAILYAPEGHRPLSIARVNNRTLLAAVAEEALSDSDATAGRLMERYYVRYFATRRGGKAQAGPKSVGR